MPEPIAKLINSIGIYKDVDHEYFCILAPNYYRNQVMAPNPESIILSNLRATVEGLSNVNVPQHLRLYFRNRCPFPGAIWNADSILQNPENYTTKL